MIKRVMLFFSSIILFFCIFGVMAQINVLAVSISEDIKTVCDEYCEYCSECIGEIDQLEANIKNDHLDSALGNINEISLTSFLAMSSVENLLDQYNIEDTNIKCLRTNMVEIRKMLQNTLDDVNSRNVMCEKLFICIKAMRVKFEFAHREACEIGKSMSIKRECSKYCRLCNSCISLIEECARGSTEGNLSDILPIIGELKLKSFTAISVIGDVAYDFFYVENIEGTEFAKLYLVVDNLHDLSIAIENYLFVSSDSDKKNKDGLEIYLNRLMDIVDDLKAVSEKAKEIANKCLVVI